MNIKKIVNDKNKSQSSLNELKYLLNELKMYFVKNWWQNKFRKGYV